MHGVEAKGIDFPAIDGVIEEATSSPTSTTKKCSTQR
jgi:hypothetical protein